MAKNNNEKSIITISEHPDFPVTNDCALLTSYKVSKYINTLFHNVFNDYAGSVLYVDQSSFNNYHPVQVELYFAMDFSSNENDDNLKPNAFARLTDNLKNKYRPNEEKTNFLEQVVGYNAMITQNKTCVITQEGIDMITPLLWRDVNGGLPNNPKPEIFAKKGITVESVVPRQTHNYQIQPQQNIVYSIIRFVDINSILSLLFGETNEGYVYQISPIKPLTAQTPQLPNVDLKWLFAVHRINQRNFSDLCNDIGQLSYTNGLNMYTEYYDK